MAVLNQTNSCCFSSPDLAMDIESRPMMLKDFLGYCNSCSKVENPINNQPILLLRSRSKRAAATTISAIQKVISVVNFFHFKSVKSPPLVLRRSNSRRRLTDAREGMAKVKVKDILRWRSFRDLEEDQPLDSPTHATVNFSSSTWSESDLILNQDYGGSIEEESDSEQESPVSVLYSPFHPVKHTKRFHQEIPLDKRTPPASNFEDRAKQLFGEPGAIKTGLDWNLVMDFYMDEVISGKAEDPEVLSSVRSWMNGEYEEMYEWELEDNRKAYVKDMERGVSWSKFKQELDEVSRELEFELLDDLLVDSLAQ